MVEDKHFAFFGTLLWLGLAAAMVYLGGSFEHKVVLWSLLGGAVSQFLAQDDRRWVLAVALIIQYMSMFLVLGALVHFTFFS